MKISTAAPVPIAAPEPKLCSKCQTGLIHGGLKKDCFRKDEKDKDARKKAADYIEKMTHKE